MKVDQFPSEMQECVIPRIRGEYLYRCLECGGRFGIEELLYTCPKCRSVLLIEDSEWERLKEIPGAKWRRIFDYRKMLNVPALSGIYRFHELIGSIIPLDDIVFLGEGHTPVVLANETMKDWAGIEFYFKNDGQNPSASFKDRGMASAFSYLNYLINKRGVGDVVAICASTGDTSASAALYASYMARNVKSVVLLPKGRVTPEQLGQPLGSGARVIEIPGVFDDCMKVVEFLSENFSVALMNSKNAWRILGQESYSYEIAQAFDYQVGGLAVVVPIGNAGNITAVMAGFLKMYDLRIIDSLPAVIGVQSEHANPVYLYYLEPEEARRKFRPVKVRPSVAQAAMIGNPVSMPRVIKLVEQYRKIAGEGSVRIVQITEQEIMDSMLFANRNGHIACTQGGECLAGIRKAAAENKVDKSRKAILDATAHVLKFADFQNKYFSNTLKAEFEVVPKPGLRNAKVRLRLPHSVPMPEGGTLSPDQFEKFVKYTSSKIAKILQLKQLECKKPER